MSIPPVAIKGYPMPLARLGNPSKYCREIWHIHPWCTDPSRQHVLHPWYPTMLSLLCLYSSSTSKGSVGHNKNKTQGQPSCRRGAVIPDIDHGEYGEHLRQNSPWIHPIHSEGKKSSVGLIAASLQLHPFEPWETRRLGPWLSGGHDHISLLHL